jgi:hypothetical protein
MPQLPPPPPLHRGANKVKERFMKAPLLDLVRWHATACMPWRCCEGQTTTLSPFLASLYALPLAG